MTPEMQKSVVKFAEQVRADCVLIDLPTGDDHLIHRLITLISDVSAFADDVIADEKTEAEAKAKAEAEKNKLAQDEKWTLRLMLLDDV